MGKIEEALAKGLGIDLDGVFCEIEFLGEDIEPHAVCNNIRAIIDFGNLSKNSEFAWSDICLGILSLSMLAVDADVLLDKAAVLKVVGEAIDKINERSKIVLSPRM